MCEQDNSNRRDESRLLELAKVKFTDLTDTEEKLINCTASGLPAEFRTGNELIDNPKNADKWGEERTIRADIIEWLCTDIEAKGLVTKKGIQVAGIKVRDRIELSYLDILFPILLLRCSLLEGVDLAYTRIRSLRLDGTQTGSINADMLKADESIDFSQGFKSLGEVRLAGAEIGGQLNCAGGHFYNPKRYAILAEGIIVKHSVLLNNGFKADGNVSFAGAEIYGQLNCEHGSFCNKNGSALSADGIIIRGGAFLQDGFNAFGEVRFRGAKIYGTLNLKGSFRNASGKAINAGGIFVDGDVFLSDNFSACGEVNLSGAVINGDLGCANSEILNGKGISLLADKIRVKGTVFLRDNFKSVGELRLIGARIEGNLNLNRANLDNAHGKALNCEGTRIDGNLQCNNTDIRGVIILFKAIVKGVLQWKKNCSPNNVVIDLRSANIDTIIDDKESWPSKGNLFLDGLEYNKFAEEAPLKAVDRIDWLNLQNGKHFHPQPYEQLADVYQKSGHEENAKKVLIEKNKAQIRSGGLNWYDRLWLQFLGITVGFGYRPRNTLAICIIIIILGTVFFELGRIYDCMVPPGSGSVVISGNFPSMNAIAYSLDAFIPLINLGQVENWIPNYTLSDKCFIWEKGYLLCWWFWIETLSGWIFTTLLIVGLSGLIKR